MTDKNKKSPQTGESTATSQTDLPPTTERQSSSKAGVITGAVAILIALGLTGGLFYHGHQQSSAQQQALASLQSQLASQKESQTQLQASITENNATLKSQIDTVTQSEKLASAQLETVQLAIANLKMRNPNEWMLTEAEYLIRMAGRKLALEQDVETSIALLASANGRITELNDPSLLPLRKVIEQDITKLANLPKIDRDGIALKLSIQANAVDQLTIATLTRPEPEEEAEALSTDTADWKENLTKSWQSFSQNFISVRRTDGNVEALLSPNQAWFLTENLKTKLLQAELAVYRQNQEAFNNSIDTSINWVERYFDKALPNTKAMLNALNGLKGTEIIASYPTKLDSAALIQTTIRERKIQTLTASSAQ